MPKKPRLKTCTKCKIAKPIYSFYDNFRYRDGKFSWCKKCQRKQVKYNYQHKSRKMSTTNRKLRRKNRLEAAELDFKSDPLSKGLPW